MNLQIEGFTGLVQILALGFFITTAVVHIVFALGVYASADGKARRGGVHFAHPVFWAAATLLGGVFVATAYWLVHLSALSSPEPHSDSSAD